VALDLDLHDERFDEPVEVAAYYVTSELTRQHRQTRRRIADRFVANHWLALTVTDDGAGGAQPDNGTGLTGVADRVEALGGTVLVDSRPGLGTTIRVRLPIGPSV
jgi:signal transduction histidine kinase